jgi:hypothetical protein
MEMINKIIMTIFLLMALIHTEVLAIEINPQKDTPESFRIYTKKFIDNSAFPYSRTEVTIKILFKSLQGIEDIKQIEDYLFNILDTAMSEKNWIHSRYSRNSERFKSSGEWQSWAEQLPIDLEVDPDAGMNIKLETNLVIYSYVYICDQDKLWNMKKYRKGGHFYYKDKERKIIYFNQEKELKIYFQDVIEKTNNCILERFNNLEEEQ